MPGKSAVLWHWSGQQGPPVVGVWSFGSPPGAPSLEPGAEGARLAFGQLNPFLQGTFVLRRIARGRLRAPCAAMDYLGPLGP